jgi:putative FmdB family regulatory protein
MPLYEYECDACGARFELIQKFADPPAETCKVCGKGPVRKLVAAPAFQFKGSGWYATDYAKKPASAPSEKDGASAGSASAATDKKDAASADKPAAEKKKSDDKPAAKAPAKDSST